jgi:uncharacterized protein YndB with AHSA1/START domain
VLVRLHYQLTIKETAMSQEKKSVTIQTTVNAPAQKVWEYFNTPSHVTQWNTPSPDWHSPKAENDLRQGGTFNYRMEAKDGSFGFDFGGVYDEVTEHKRLAYTLGDGRKVSVDFNENTGAVHISETFETEDQNPIEMQQAGWQSILDNFKSYTENN